MAMPNDGNGNPQPDHSRTGTPDDTHLLNTQSPSPTPINRRNALIGAGIIGAAGAVGAGIGVVAANQASSPVSKYTPPPVRAKVGISAEDGIHPGNSFTVDVADGHLKSVTVTDSEDRELAGELNDEATQWTSQGTMLAEQEYTVAATAVSDDDLEEDFTESFTTGEVEAGNFAVSWAAPVDDDAVGVGAPIIVQFTKPAPDKVEVEKLLHVESEKGHNGAWRWKDNTTIIYRTEEYWDPNQTVTFTANFKNAYLGNDEWGTESFSTEMKIGRERITKIDMPTCEMEIFVDGAKDRTYPTSGGKPGWETPSGTYLVMNHEGTVRMRPNVPEDDPEYYDLDVDWSTRMSNSGIYVHSAPWSEADQGKNNVSHGCLNLMPKRAKWFHETSLRGDPIQVTNTDSHLEWWDGWSYWQLTFDEWKEGSALV
ncbi:L,D-transpeptidase [Haloglycomyces albus]|uniref:L,D-transpeptidase n=1 Tax=Haloglycomyces albus TaxID=526067 RepID=UPI00046D3D5F|nr:Ig-like domain-containing protein [Haloglycomyces albus]